MGSQLPPTSSSTHRLPTISASDALRKLRESGSQTIPTGLPALDTLLAGDGISTYGRGGLVRGQLTEFLGPPGCGKTAVAVQIAASALNEEAGVVWVDTASRVARSRLLNAVGSEKSLNELHAYYTPTIAHLLAIIGHPAAEFPPPKTSLVIIDNASTLFPFHFTRKGLQSRTQTPLKSTGTNLQSALLKALIRFASTHNVAVVVMSQVITRIRYNEAGTSGRAFLIPAQDGKEWDDAFSSRVAIYRDFVPHSAWTMKRLTSDYNEAMERFRYARVLKAHGKSLDNDRGRQQGSVPFGITVAGKAIPFTFSADQISEAVRSSPLKMVNSTDKLLKRGRDEVPNSEEEDNWSDDDSLDNYDWSEEGLDVQIVSVRTASGVDGLGRLDDSKKKLKSDHSDAKPNEAGAPESRETIADQTHEDNVGD